MPKLTEPQIHRILEDARREGRHRVILREALDKIKAHADDPEYVRRVSTEALDAITEDIGGDG